MQQLQLYRERELPGSALCYVMDPMCSWCWAYQPVLQALLASDRLTTPLLYVMGGLAPENEQPMAATTRQQIETIWRHIEARTGVRFNYDFWQHNIPRRSTYPACKAVLAAEAALPGSFSEMIGAIQQAYYAQARNPSERATLTAIASEIGIDAGRFDALMNAEPQTEALYRHLRFRDQLRVEGYPSLVWWRQGEAIPVTYGYCDLETTLAQLRRAGY